MFLNFFVFDIYEREDLSQAQSSKEKGVKFCEEYR